MKLSCLWRAPAVALVAAALLSGGIVRQASAAKPVLAADAKIDLNTATADQLEQIQGVGPAIAKKIIAGRPYTSIDDLKKAGISAKLISKISPWASVAASEAPATSPKAITTDTKPTLVDLNKATKAELMELPGIAEINAKKIIAGRPYKSVDDLSKAGIPAATVTKISALVTVAPMKTVRKVGKPVLPDTGAALIDLNAATAAELKEAAGRRPGDREEDHRRPAVQIGRRFVEGRNFREGVRQDQLARDRRRRNARRGFDHAQHRSPGKRHGVGQHGKQGLPQGRERLVRQDEARQVHERSRRHQGRLSRREELSTNRRGTIQAARAGSPLGSRRCSRFFYDGSVLVKEWGLAPSKLRQCGKYLRSRGACPHSFCPHFTERKNLPWDFFLTKPCAVGKIRRPPGSTQSAHERDRAH